MLTKLTDASYEETAVLLEEFLKNYWRVDMVAKKDWHDDRQQLIKKNVSCRWFGKTQSQK